MKLNDNLPLDGRALRNELNNNFRQLNSSNGDDIDVEKILAEYKEKIDAEIAAIIDPRYNDIALEIEQARVDSEGYEHTSINARIIAEIKILKKKMGVK